ncbi:MAG: hypothetical protein RR496_07490 [Lachnospiraceae bacterium]
MALVEEIRKLTRGMLFQNPKGGKLLNLNVYAQALPIPTRQEMPREFDPGNNTIDYIDGSEEEAVFKCPWCLVKLDNGVIGGINGQQQVEVGINFGIYNGGLENQGHMEIMNLIHKVYERFSTSPILDKQYICKGSFEWGLLEEDMHPYFFGAIGTTFEFAGFRREVNV